MKLYEIPVRLLVEGDGPSDAGPVGDAVRRALAPLLAQLRDVPDPWGGEPYRVIAAEYGEPTAGRQA